MNEEPFGPLARVNPVRNLDEAIEKANSLPFGLAAYAFTRWAHNADRLANETEAGNLSINHFVALVAETPFGGVKGQRLRTRRWDRAALWLHGRQERIAFISGFGRAMKRSKCRTTAMTTTTILVLTRVDALASDSVRAINRGIT